MHHLNLICDDSSATSCVQSQFFQHINQLLFTLQIIGKICMQFYCILKTNKNHVQQYICSSKPALISNYLYKNTLEILDLLFVPSLPMKKMIIKELSSRDMYSSLLNCHSLSSSIVDKRNPSLFFMHLSSSIRCLFGDGDNLHTLHCVQ